MSRFSEHYDLLGIRPGEPWEVVRSAYKAKIKRWHPDRFAQDADAIYQAEEMTKRLNQAYQEIHAYYDEHGVLPLSEEPDLRPMPNSRSHHETGDRKPQNETFSYRPTSTEPLHSEPRASSRLAALAALAILVALFWLSDPTPEPVPVQTGTITTPDAKNASTSVNETPAPSNLQRSSTKTEKTINVGMPIGEVYSIQGVPTRTDGDVWYYGSAKIVFQNGHVSHWVDSEPPVLRTPSSTNPASAMEANAAPGFSYGSTKEEVRAIQGNPLQESTTIWFYGQSQIRFDRNGRVIGWTESPYQPLRIKR